MLKFGCEGDEPLYGWFITRMIFGFNVAPQLHGLDGFVQLQINNL